MYSPIHCSKPFLGKREHISRKKTKIQKYFIDLIELLVHNENNLSIIIKYSTLKERRKASGTELL